MTWRYCITRERLDDGSIHYALREVYTDDDGSLSWTANPITASGETWQEIANDLGYMSNAAGMDVLDLTLDPPAFVVSPVGIDR